ncbi:hypothetical protein LOKO_03329 [Halomonas chromatireducens]|uniref:Uncharacterized protein n=1 Tax=Halomonas chromatireducens TaxID=507626 RepID=A0A109UN48_9GAMM|nr:hypothetical protein LOKO_03329 [Halomonas chromatireducens]
MPNTQHVASLSSEVLDHWVSHAIAQQAAQQALAAYIR